MMLNSSLSFVVCRAFGMFAMVLLILTVAGADDWARFRGAGGAGISQATDVPVVWSETNNVKWRTRMPGSGFSSPIVVGDKVFVTCYSGYGLDREKPGQIANLKRHLVCVDRETGKIAWTADVAGAQTEDSYQEYKDSYKGVITEHGYASHTPVSDGQRVYVFFGKAGVLAFDMEGHLRWQTSVGTGSDPARRGSAASPILYENLVIVTASTEAQSLVALDKTTGKEVWRNKSPKLTENWSTPLLVGGENNRTLVVVVLGEVWGIDPATGKSKWQIAGLKTETSAASLVESGGAVLLYRRWTQSDELCVEVT